MPQSSAARRTESPTPRSRPVLSMDSTQRSSTPFSRSSSTGSVRRSAQNPSNRRADYGNLHFDPEETDKVWRGEGDAKTPSYEEVQKRMFRPNIGAKERNERTDDRGQPVSIYSHLYNKGLEDLQKRVAQCSDHALDEMSKEWGGHQATGIPGAAHNLRRNSRPVSPMRNGRPLISRAPSPAERCPWRKRREELNAQDNARRVGTNPPKEPVKVRETESSKMKRTPTPKQRLEQERQASVRRERASSQPPANLERFQRPTAASTKRFEREGSNPPPPSNKIKRAPAKKVEPKPANSENQPGDESKEPVKEQKDSEKKEEQAKPQEQDEQSKEQDPKPQEEPKKEEPAKEEPTAEEKKPSDDSSPSDEKPADAEPKDEASKSDAQQPASEKPPTEEKPADATAKTDKKPGEAPKDEAK